MHDLAYFAGTNVRVIVLWLPIAVILTSLFHPTFNATPLGVAVFLVAIWARLCTIWRKEPDMKAS